ncbi:MAG: hypothetical protein WA093_02100 [Minisyncoccales bacterium]
MRTDFIQTIIFGAFKLALLALLVVLGVVFIPDGFMDRVAGGIDGTVNFLQGETAKRAPVIARDTARQFEETKADAGNIYQSFKEEYYPAVGDWFAGLFGYKAK